MIQQESKLNVADNSGDQAGDEDGADSPRAENGLQHASTIERVNREAVQNGPDEADPDEVPQEPPDGRIGEGGVDEEDPGKNAEQDLDPGSG